MRHFMKLEHIVMAGAAVLLANGAGAKSEVKAFHLEEATISDVHAACSKDIDDAPATRIGKGGKRAMNVGRAHALVEPMILLTNDEVLRGYGSFVNLS
jgi:hypothetical protein